MDRKEKTHRNLTEVFLNNGPQKDPPASLTAAEVTEDLLKSRSASLNFRFLLSFLLLEFLKHTQETHYKHQAMSVAQAEDTPGQM